MLIDKIREIICDLVDIEPEEITPDSRLLSDIGLSSLDVVMLSSEIEREFGVTITPRTFAMVKTVGGVIEHIEKEMK